MGTRNDSRHDPLSDYSELVRNVAGRVTAFHQELQGQLPVRATETPNYYHAYPFLFREAFPSVSDEQAITLAVAGVLYLNHLCLLDDLVDSHSAPAPHQLFLSSLLHEEAVLQLGTLLPSSSPFWQELSSYHREFVVAMMNEQTLHTARLLPYLDAEIFQTAKGKAALSKMTTTALSLLADQPERIHPLAASQDYFNAARQLYDDVKDWKEDFLAQRYSSLLTAALLQLCPAGTADIPAVVPVEALSAQLHEGGHVDRALTQAALWCDEALAQVAQFPVTGWVRLVQSLRSQLVRLRDDLAAIRQQAQTDIAQPAATTAELEVESV